MSQILGLPLNTWIIVGGSFILSALSPLILGIIIINGIKRRENKDE